MKKNKFKLLLHYTKIVKKERGASKARIFFLRSLLFYDKTIKWLDFIDNIYKKYELGDAPWNLVGLPIRAYVSHNLTLSTRLKLLHDHYSLIEQNFSKLIVKNILEKKPIRLSTLISKDDIEYHFELCTLDRYWREGGLTIYLTDNSGDVLTTLTFSFGKNTIMIGGLQGTALGKSKIVHITRKMGGLRPKHALLECCYEIANHLKIETIIGVSNKNHVFNKQEGKINASYNEFWKEIGGFKMKDSNYKLPLALAKRSFEEVPQKKRKDWLIRHEHIKKLKSDTLEFLNKNGR